MATNLPSSVSYAYQKHIKKYTKEHRQVSRKLINLVKTLSAVKSLPYGFILAHLVPVLVSVISFSQCGQTVEVI